MLHSYPVNFPVNLVCFKGVQETTQRVSSEHRNRAPVSFKKAEESATSEQNIIWISEQSTITILDHKTWIIRLPP